ncbi:MAG: acetolactate synthase large subunit [Alphaproteobacteria bacterium]|nr:acetolactate synthase large subunit [Alphaproteobacteria bacterium]
MTARMNGAELLVAAAHTAGIRICFANPGTTELTLVRALETEKRIRPVLCLFEGVCTGAADGYARVSGSVALTLTHLGPGFANGIANLHNARRAHSRIVNVVGEHATWHQRYDAPLHSDIESLARPVSGSVVRLQSELTLQRDLNAAFEASADGSVTIIAPTDLMDAQVSTVQAFTASPRQKRCVAEDHIKACAAALSSGGPVILLLGGNGLREPAQRAAARVADRLSARLIMEPYPAIVPLGGDLPALERLAYFPQDVRAQLGDAKIILAGARAPISYFGYEGEPSELVARSHLIDLADADDDCADALERLGTLLPACTGTVSATAAPVPNSAPAQFAPAGIAEEVAAQVPENAVVSLEGSTLGGPYLRQAHRAKRHRVMTNTGGAIGQGLPCAVGAALAEPDARVIALQSDGSAQYTLQSLWTMAREKLKVAIIIAANHRYGILQTELRRAGVDPDDAVPRELTYLEHPRVNWVSLADGYGVPGRSVSTMEEFRTALRTALETDGPYLIQVELD